MKKILIPHFVALLAITFCFNLKAMPVKHVGDTSLVTYTAPNDIIEKSDYKVYVKVQGESLWKDLFVYTTKVNVRNALNKSGFSSYSFFDSDFEKPIEIKIVYANKFNDVKIRPTLYGIVPTKSGNNTVEFALSKPEKISVEFDGDRQNNLLIFGNPIESTIVNANDPNVIYFGPGQHNVSNLQVKDGQIIYIDGSAVLNGMINIYNKNNITICGRGILNGSSLEHARDKTRPNLLKIKNGNNIKIEGIIVVDSPDWGIYLAKCNKVVVNNVKTINYMINGDGFDIDGCSHVTASDMFIRSADDNISLKSLDGSGCSNINIVHTILWADNAHNMLVGPESRGAVFNDINFENDIVLENTEQSALYSGVMSIMASDNGQFTNINWNHIYIDDISAGQAINLQFVTANSKTQSYGNSISNVNFSNIYLNGHDTNLGSISGYSPNKNINAVTITDFNVNGVKLTQDKISVLPNAVGEVLNKIKHNTGNLTINGYVKDLYVK